MTETSNLIKEGGLSSCLQLLGRRKSLESILEEERKNQDDGSTKLGLFDLLCIGIGSTIGSGVFVLTGKALPVAGPSTVLAWVIAGLVCLLSSASYMELASRLPTKGSCYVYSYHGLGELAGVVGSVCLTMEYGISGAGVARSWSTKLSHLLGVRFAVCYNGAAWGQGCDYDDDYYFDIVAALITAVAAVVVMTGGSLGKAVVNSFTAAKVLLVTFMVVAGFYVWDPSVWNPFASLETFAPKGPSGTLSATSLLFFGFIGFDEVCCMASKAKDPSKTVPRALVGTLVGAAFFSGLAQAALVCMVPYSEGMGSTSFEEAFQSQGLGWAGWLVSIGELILLPLVVLLSVLPQPELMAAMSEDGLLPPIFKRQRANGVYFQGTVVVGVALMMVAFVVPFSVLWDIISLGTLFSFNLTNASLINIRYGNGGQLCEPVVNRLTWLLMACAAAGALAMHHGLAPWLEGGEASVLALALGGAALLAGAGVAARICAFEVRCDMEDKTVYKALGVPFVPGVAMFLNFFLMASFALSSVAIFVIFVLVFFGAYLGYVCGKGKSSSEVELAPPSEQEPH